MAVQRLVSICKEHYPDLQIYIWSGYTFEELKKRAKTEPLIYNILQYCDVLIDGQYQKDLRDTTLPLRGSANQKIINLRKEL